MHVHRNLSYAPTFALTDLTVINLKDFGISGFRCGVLHTLNKELFRLISSGYQIFHDISAQTQASYGY